MVNAGDFDWKCLVVEVQPLNLGWSRVDFGLKDWAESGSRQSGD